MKKTKEWLQNAPWIAPINARSVSLLHRPLISVRQVGTFRDRPAKRGWNDDGYTDVFGRALASASTVNKTLIITMVNRAYVEGDKLMLDLFLDSFWLGEGTRPLTDHLLILMVDGTSFDLCRFLRLHCYWLEPMTRNFEGFIFKDTDVMWLRDPFPELTAEESIDLQITVDNFNCNQRSPKKPIYTGLYMIRWNNRTISLPPEWYNGRKYSGRDKEQGTGRAEANGGGGRAPEAGPRGEVPGHGLFQRLLPGQQGHSTSSHGQCKSLPKHRRKACGPDGGDSRREELQEHVIP